MKFHRVCGVLFASMGMSVLGTASADVTTTGTIVLNTFNKVVWTAPEGPTRKDPNTGNIVPKVGKCTGVGLMDAQLKIDDSPTAKANFATNVPLLMVATRSDSQVNPNSNDSYMQGAFAVLNLGVNGPQLDTMKVVNLARLNGDRAWMKANIGATNDYYLTCAATEDNGQNNNPQVGCFVYDKATLQPVKVLNSNRRDSLVKPTNLIELSGKNDNQQYGPHSMVRVPETDNAFVMGVQRNNQNAYVLRVDVEKATGGVNLNVKYLNKVIDQAQHCRPDVVTNAKEPNIGYLASVEADNQPANIGVRVLKFNLTTGEKLKSTLVCKSDPGKNKYCVQPNIADLGDHIGVSYQISQKTRSGNGHTGGSNLSMLAMLDKASLTVVGQPMSGVAAVARHAGAIGALWGEDGKEMPTVVSLAGSSTGTGKAFAQLIPADTTQNVLGTKDPQKLYELAQFSDLAGTVVRGKRNPNNQARGFIYAESNIPNPGWNGGANAFMPEVKTFIGAAVQGYADNGAALLAARESIWLSLLPSTWIAGASTTPGGVTDKPGTNPDGTGPLPRVDGPGTSTDPQAQPPPSVIPGGDSPTPPSGGGPGGNDFNDSAGGCAVSSRGTSGAGGLFLVGLGALLRIRRRAPKRGEN